MAGVTYKIYGARLGAQFSFDLAIESDSTARLLATSGRWRISRAKGLGPLEPALAPGGTWQHRRASAEEPGFLFLKARGRALPFDIALNDVPDDYVHGPFCSTNSGTGTLAASVQEDIKIEWEVAGPGCV
jgi:hypothetical protein